ncbi:MAG: lipopolysaccharide biosynthesis protein [Acidobacteriaceae bacterium]|nr:lipopolysaccharide biosynthesis protein [Acidobacteriaceae bacterium]
MNLHTEEQNATTPERFAIITPDDLQAPDSEISLIEILAILLRWKKFIAVTTLAITALASVAVFLLPPSYTAEATILPPQQQQSSLSALASGALGGLAASSMASQLGLKNPADLYIGILKSRTIADDIVNKFGLQQVYRTKFESDTRKALSSHASFTSGKESLITISVRDHDPRRAATMANAFIDELYKANSRLAITDASQRRLFFEQELKQEKDALANAEVALKTTEQNTGFVAPTGQAEVLIRSGAQLRAEIASREVQLQAMRSYATDQNPRVEVLKREISALQAQLGQVESSSTSGSSFDLSARKLPEAGMEYIRKMRDLKYHETLYELLAKQYEAARIDEAKQSPLIQVVDRAVAPDKDSRPSRMLLVVACALAAAVLTAGGVLCFNAIQKLLASLKNSDDAASRLRYC